MFRRKTDQPSIDVSRLSSLIATGVQIAGDVIVTDGVRIDGQVAGNVMAKPESKGLLVLSEQGRIEGNVRVHDAVVNAFADPAVKEAMAKQGNVINVGPTDKAMPFFRSELAKYAQIVKKAGIEAQ